MPRFIWSDDNFEERISDRMARRLKAVALAFQAECKADLSISNPAPHMNPAPRGQHPRGRTWNLRDSVVIDPIDLESIARTGRVRVGVLKGAQYGFFLWKKGWLGIVDTLDRCRDRLSKIFGRPI